MTVVTSSATERIPNLAKRLRRFSIVRTLTPRRRAVILFGEPSRRHVLLHYARHYHEERTTEGKTT